MPKTGWKYTKQGPDRSKTNMVKRSAASSKVNRTAPKRGDLNMRSKDTINRLNMYNNGKAIRNKEGTIVGGQFMMSDRAGDSKITGATGRIAPDRRWFGNTRVVSSTDLDKFRNEMLENSADPYSVVLQRKKLPMGLLSDAANAMQSSSQNKSLITNEPFQKTFGSKSQRKKVKLDQLLIGQKGQIEQRENIKKRKKEVENSAIITGQATATNANITSLSEDDPSSGYAALLSSAKLSQDSYAQRNNAQGIVPWGKDTDIELNEGEGVDWFIEKNNKDIFRKGQSKRIWNEFYKVIDCSDVILHVIDARDVPGTTCQMIEEHVTKNAKHKHLIYVINKIDLVPNWVAKRWVGEYAAKRPTIAFHSSLTHAFGKAALINLLRQFGQLMKERKQISIGVVGYPNVGKSSVINTIKGKKSCNVAPIPGETKVWQYIKVFKNIFLIDCPGVVVDTAGDTESQSVLKGVVRAERLETPEEYIENILSQVQRAHIAAQYDIPVDGEDTWTDANDFLERVAKRYGYLLKGGEPNIRTSAISVINDFQRGKLPHFVKPPDLKEEEIVGNKNEERDTDDKKMEENNIDEIMDVDHYHKDNGIDDVLKEE